MKRAILIPAIVAFAVLGIAALAEYGPRETPAGQPPLVRLSASNLDTLRQSFNDSADTVRVLALLSPT
jgi:hypothetical protein